MAEYLCKLADLQQATPKVVRASNRVVALVRIDDDVYAVDAFCPHWAGPLGEGTVSVSRREIICPWHRFRFSLEDGRCVASNNRPPVQTFPVHVNGEDVFAEIPKRATASSRDAEPATSSSERS